MDSIGAEVGQKMRSAIKAKLLELNCYVDEELPDYVMVMVANKRSKSQMNEDLTLFLNEKTSTFVDWLHIVLKKLKEVTVTNPEVYKKVTKKKSAVKVKKEKKPLKDVKLEEETTSLTDNLPIIPSKFAENRRTILLNNDDDNFDIPLLSEVHNSNENDLKEIEKKIKSVKSRLGLLVESDEEKDKESKNNAFKEEKNSLKDNRIIEIRPENDEENSRSVVSKETEENFIIEEPVSSKRKHTPIVFDRDEEEPVKKRSALERLGGKTAEKRLNRIKLSEFRKDEEKYLGSSRKRERSRERNENKHNRSRSPRHKSPSGRSASKHHKTKSVFSRIGLMSTVHVPQKNLELAEKSPENPRPEVPSVVQVKPRTIPADAPQPNKNLLLKAVAEAQRSVAQTRKVRSNQSEIKRKKMEDGGKSRRFSKLEKAKLRNLILSQVAQVEKEEELEDVYIPKPLFKAAKEGPQYVPSSAKQEYLNEEEKEKRQKFVITPEGIERIESNNKQENKKIEDEEPIVQRIPAKLRLQGRKSPSPIIFDKVTTKISGKINIPDKLPMVHPPLSIKNKERCKYWPNCRQGDKCEFVHPSTNCENFPNCKFGDKCLYLHPVCKFGTSCTKRECPYNHQPVQKTTTPKVTLQVCKYFPSCANINCTFYHPKLCKYGKYCKNQAECSYSHHFISKSNLTWRSK